MLNPPQGVSCRGVPGPPQKIGSRKLTGRQLTLDNRTPHQRLTTSPGKNDVSLTTPAVARVFSCLALNSSRLHRRRTNRVYFCRSVQTRRCQPQQEAQNSEKIRAPILVCVDPRGGCLPTPYPGTGALRLYAREMCESDGTCADWRELRNPYVCRMYIRSMKRISMFLSDHSNYGTQEGIETNRAQGIRTDSPLH